MNVILPVIATSVLCLLLVGAILVLTIYLIVRKGRETLSDISEGSSTANSTPTQTTSGGANTRWAHGDLKAAPDKSTGADQTRTCPACGAPNPHTAGVCGSCGRVL